MEIGHCYGVITSIRLPVPSLASKSNVNLPGCGRNIEPCKTDCIAHLFEIDRLLIYAADGVYAASQRLLGKLEIHGLCKEPEEENAVLFLALMSHAL